jgi:hypothetical protein
LIGKEHLHFAWRAKVAFATALEQTARGVEGEALANAAEHVGEVAVLRVCIAYSAGRHQRQTQASREIDKGLVAVLLGAKTMSLQLDVQPFGKDAVKVLELAFGGVETAVDETLGDDTLGAAGKTEEAVGVGFYLAPTGTGFALGPSACGLGEQAAEVAVAATITREQGQPRQRGSGRGRVGDEA